LTNHTEHALDLGITLAQYGGPKNAPILLRTNPVGCVVFEALSYGINSEVHNLCSRILQYFVPKSRLDELSRIDTEVVLKQENYTPPSVFATLQKYIVLPHSAQLGDRKLEWLRGKVQASSSTVQNVLTRQ